MSGLTVQNNFDIYLIKIFRIVASINVTKTILFLFQLYVYNHFLNNYMSYFSFYFILFFKRKRNKRVISKLLLI